LDCIKPLTSEDRFYGWKNAWLLFFIYMAATGFVFYAYTVVFPEMVAVTGWNRGDASIASSISMLMMGFLVPLVAVILNRIGSRLTILTGLIILFAGLLLLGTVRIRMWHWIVLWGVIIPAGVGLCGFFPVQMTVMSWFARKRATALGFVMTGAALGGFIAQPLYTWVIANTGDWQMGWRLSAGIVFGALILSYWVKGKPADIGQVPDGVDPQALKTVKDLTGTRREIYRTTTSWQVREVFRTSTIWCIIGVMITQGSTTILINTHGILHITDLGYSSMQAASVLMLVILGSGFGRFPMGWLGDRIEPRRIAFVTLVFMLASFIGFWRAPNFTSLLVFGPLFGICYGTILVMISTMIANYFGPDSYVKISACISPFLTILGATVPTASGYAADRLGSYDLPFGILTGVILSAVVFSLLISPPRKAGRQNRQPHI